MDIFKDRIDPLILSSGKDASEIEKAIGLTRGTISKWRNTNLKSYLSYIEKIADYFGVSIAYIFGETDEKSPSPDEDRLSLEEYEVLKMFRGLDDTARKVLITQIRALSASSDFADDSSKSE